MQKTKLGISVGFLGAILYFIGLFGGLWVTIAAVAYVWIREEDLWIKRTAAKVLSMTFLFPIILLVLGFIPDLIYLCRDMLAVLDISINLDVITKMEAVTANFFNIVKYVFFILLAVFAYFQKTLRLPLIDYTIEKHIN